VAHKPWRWYSAEQFLKGKQATDKVFEAAAVVAIKETKTLPDNAYKSTMLQGAMEVALKNCLNA
jgi:xanthine dehydrogenase YagS FAD-binding subunit